MDVGLVCDACSALTPIGVPQCERCGEPMSLDPLRRGSSPSIQGSRAKGAAVPSEVACTACGQSMPSAFAFCPSCGTPQGARANGDVNPRTARSAEPGEHERRNTQFFGGALQAARAKLTVIRGDGEDGVSFALAGTDHLAGRGECPISFPEDAFLSPTHANFRYVNGLLTVCDMNSLNGVFVRIAGTVEVQSDTTILVGEQVIAVRPARTLDDASDAEGTYYSASMTRGATMELVQLLRGGSNGWVFRVDSDVVTIGREANDINFPRDPFISGHHAQIQLSGGVLSVTDLGSRNGTFVRISGEQILKHGDYVFLGQQLLRVEIV